MEALERDQGRIQDSEITRLKQDDEKSAVISKLKQAPFSIKKKCGGEQRRSLKGKNSRDILVSRKDAQGGT